VVTDGPVNASSDRFTIRIRGRGGHAARPHETVDAVVVGSLFVMAVQTIVSREINPAHPSVVTVGRFDAGTASNVIADQALLEGTIRAQEPEVRDNLDASIQRIAKSIAQLHAATVDVEIHKGTPALINRGMPTELARQAASDVVPPDYVLAMETANMGGEDFSYYVENVPGCYVRFGSMTDERHAFPAHSSRFDIDESVLAYGASYLSRVATIAGNHLSGTHEYSFDSQAESLR
jgi:hippurate hydrolase